MNSVLIIGGGHNSLVCACYLAAAGMDVTVLERHHSVGGAAVTEEFAPGFRNSVASYTVSLLHQQVIDDLRLHDHGLKILTRRVNNYLPLPDGDAFIASPDQQELVREIARFSPRDAERYPQYAAEMSELAAPVKALMLHTPPAFGNGGMADLWRMFQQSRLFGDLDMAARQQLLKLFTVSAGEWLDDAFESEPVKAWMGFDAVVGSYQSPYSPGSAYVMLHHMLGGVNGQEGAWGHAIGGMGAISQALAEEAQKRGVHIETNCAVDHLTVTGERVTELTTAAGDRYRADIIVAGINPRLLFLQLLDTDTVPAAVHRHFSQYKCASGSFRMNVALSELPRFSHRFTPECYEAGIIIAPSLDYMDAAWIDARQHGFSRQPIVEMLIPSVVDDSLAPHGQHVASLFCQQFDPGLGSNWAQHRAAAAATIINTVNGYATNFADSVVATQVFSPYDLEQRFGLLGGDIFHGRMSLEQLFSARPMLGMGQYQTHLENLYLCASGTHPGGGVSGLPGHNAAREIIRHQ